MLTFPGAARDARGSVLYDVVGAPTEVIHSGRSEVTGSVNLIVRGSGNVTGTSTGGATQIGLLYSNPPMEIDNIEGSGIRLSFSAGFAAAAPTIVEISNIAIGAHCAGLLTINLLAGAVPVAGDFIRIEGVRGRISRSVAIVPGSDLFVDLQSVNDPAANGFFPDRVRVVKSFDGLNVHVTSTPTQFNIHIEEGFSRAFVDLDASNDGFNSNDRTDSGGNLLGSPTNSTLIVTRMDGLPDGVSGILWPDASSVSETGSVLMLIESNFLGDHGTATYSFESINQVGASDLVVESFVISPGLTFGGGRTNLDDLVATATLGPEATDGASCAPPSGTPARPRFREAFELLITRLSPSTIVKGSSALTLTVHGAGFVPTSAVRWREQSRSTTFSSFSKLTATILESDLEKAGVAPITVRNDVFGDSTSNELIFTISDPALTLFFPQIVSTEASETALDLSEFTAFGLANLSGGIANLTLMARDARGMQIAGDRITNPAFLSLAAGEQAPLIDNEIFGPGFSKQNSVGWVRLESNNDQVVGFFLSFNASLEALDGADVSSDTLTSFVLPEIHRDGFTRIHVANPNDTPAKVSLSLLRADGAPRVTAVDRVIDPDGVLIGPIEEFFPGTAMLESDYLRATADVGVVPIEYFGEAHGDPAALNGQNALIGATTVYSPQYAVGGAWQSVVTVINLSSLGGTVTLKFISNDGVQIGDAQTRILAPRGKLHVTDQDFFVPAEETLREGYLTITSQAIQLAGNVVFGGRGGESFSAALPLVSTLRSRIVFTQVASDDTYYTGIAILNPNDDPASAVIQVFDRNGVVLGSKIVVIPSRRRVSLLLTEIFPELAGVQLRSGYIKMTVNRNVASFALFGSDGVLSAIPAQALR